MDPEAKGILKSISATLVSLDGKLDKVRDSLEDHRVSDEGNFKMLQAGQAGLAREIGEVKQARKEESDRRHATVRAQVEKKDQWALAKYIARLGLIGAIIAAFIGAWATSYFESRSHKKAIDDLKTQVMNHHQP